MENLKLWIAKRFFKDMFIPTYSKGNVNTDAGGSSSSGNRETVFGLIKKLGLRFGDASNSKDYEEPEFDLKQIMEGCNVDSYLRQGIEKYVDQIFKEGYKFYGKDENTVEYIRLRFEYMAEATDVPIEIFFHEIAEDFVKYSNCVLAKSRSNDPNAFPPSVTVAGLNDKDPIAGYFAINPTTTKVRRDKNGTIKGWQQEVEGADKPIKFNPEDVVHMYYKRERGNAYGTPFLIPVLNDVRALREAEDNVLKMMYRNIYPFLHAKVGTDKQPGSPTEVDTAKAELEGMDVDGGLVTSSRVDIKAVETNQVIDAEPYLRYMEDRIFSGMGIPGILFGRGGTANRSTGDNMSNEMSDRIRAIQKAIETFINFKIIKELLLEGGYDPILNPDQLVEFRFNDNDIDCQIKEETHAIYKYEHNAITEDEMRNLMGMDPITDRSGMHQTLITQANAQFEASLKASEGTSTGSSSTKTKQQNGTKATNNKQKPTNQHGEKTSPKKTTNSLNLSKTSVKDIYLDNFKKEIIRNIDENNLEAIKHNIAIYSRLVVDSIENSIDDNTLYNEFVKFGLLLNDEINIQDNKEDLLNLTEILIDNLLENVNYLLSNKEVKQCSM